MFNFPLPRTFVLSLLCEDGKISFQNQINQSINQSINQFIITWDGVAPIIRARGSCIKRMTRKILTPERYNAFELKII